INDLLQGYGKTLMVCHTEKPPFLVYGYTYLYHTTKRKKKQAKKRKDARLPARLDKKRQL
ncbi:MAG: hypothetical protein IK130_00125, partial [Oscillospiraceae bacterium]|nr:hypothetical protein [Oscillospiraceae bacterium]